MGSVCWFWFLEISLEVFERCDIRRIQGRKGVLMTRLVRFADWVGNTQAEKIDVNRHPNARPMLGQEVPVETIEIFPSLPLDQWTNGIPQFDTPVSLVEVQGRIVAIDVADLDGDKIPDISYLYTDRDVGRKAGIHAGFLS